MKISFEQATRMKYKHIKLEGASQEVKAMDSIQDSLGAIELSTVFGYTRFYVGWETNKVFFFILTKTLLCHYTNSGALKIASNNFYRYYFEKCCFIDLYKFHLFTCLHLLRTFYLFTGYISGIDSKLGVGWCDCISGHLVSDC